MEQVTVSVIIPNYNHASFLEQRIETVLNQTYQNFEIILLDDSSTDSSKAIIENYRGNKKVSHIIYNGKNSGSTFKQWSKGARYARGKYIWIAESDDVADKEFLALMVSLLSKNEESVLATCRTAHIDEEGKIHGINLQPDPLDGKRWTADFASDGIYEITNYMRFRNTIPNASAVVFKNDADAELVELVQKEWKYCGDWFFWTLLLKRGNLVYSSKVLNFQRFHSQTTRSQKTLNEEKKRFNETISSVLQLNEFIKQKVKWFDKRYDWIFDLLITRVTFINKLNPKYFLIAGSISFAVRLVVENVKYAFTKYKKEVRFKLGAIKQKVFKSSKPFIRY